MVPLTLVAAAYFAPPAPKVRLRFDRAIDFSGLDGTQISVGVGAESKTYQATGAVAVIDPATIEIALVVFLFFGATGVHLSATADTGIVAVDGGGTWAGVDSVALPFS